MSQQSQSRNWLKLLITFAGGFALCFFLLRQCEGEVPTSNSIPKPSRHVDVKIRKIYPDTNAIWALKPTVKDPVRITPVDPVKYDSMLCKFIRTYTDSLRDSNLVMYYTDSVQGALLGKIMGYRLFIPKTIIIDSTITDSIPYPVRIAQAGLYFGAEIGGGMNTFNFGPHVEWVSRKKWTVGYRFGIPDRSHNISFKWRIFTR